MRQNRHRLLDGSRMSREAHVRFCEGLGVKFPWPTHRLLARCVDAVL